MGRVKNWWIETEEARREEEMHEADKYYWIIENFGEIQSGTSEWNKAEEKYYEQSMTSLPEQRSKLDVSRTFDFYFVKDKTRYEIFKESLSSAKMINTTNVANLNADNNLKVMLFGHIVAATEGYLSFRFTDKVLGDDTLMRRLVETDPEFNNKKFTLNEIYKRHESLKDDVEKYLKELIFHNLPKVKSMYKSVLEVDFGEIEFLYKAVHRRHDCVHRAGYDKDGEKLSITKDEIISLMNECERVVSLIEEKLGSEVIKEFIYQKGKKVL